MTIRTTVSIDETLLRRARQVAGTSSPSQLMTMGLTALIREARRKELIEWIDRGDIELDLVDLRKMRRSRGRRPR